MKKNIQDNIIRYSYKVTQSDRVKSKNHKPLLIWFTGLSGSGKSTIANAVEFTLHQNEIDTYALDGDNIRKGLNKNLSFSAEDRTENIRRVGEVANLMLDAGLVVIAAFVSPYRKDREAVREIVGANNMCEVFVNTSIEKCMKRDVKDLYKKAFAGEIKNMTGISAPYEAPMEPEIEIKTEEYSIEESVTKVINNIIPKIKN